MSRLKSSAACAGMPEVDFAQGAPAVTDEVRSAAEGMPGTYSPGYAGWLNDTRILCSIAGLLIAGAAVGGVYYYVSRKKGRSGADVAGSGEPVPKDVRSTVQMHADSY